LSYASKFPLKLILIQQLKHFKCKKTLSPVQANC